MSKDARRPWMKFYPADWQADQALRICSMAARGLWIECVAIMHRASPYGHLLVNGRAPTEAQLSLLVGCPSDQLPDLLRELETAGVFSRNRKRVIYSRRMTRDEKRLQTSANNGKKGGNPTLSKQKGNSGQDNPQDKGGDKAQIPDARVKKDIGKPISKENGPPDKKNPEPKKSKRGTRLPDTWTLPEEWRLWALGEDFHQALSIDREGEKFRDYWISRAGAGGVKLDWQATWRNWIRNGLERGSGKPFRKPSANDELDAAFDSMDRAVLGGQQ